MGNTSRQRGTVATLMYERKIGPFTLTPLFEFAHFDGWDGVDGQDRTYITAALATAWKSWNLSLSYTDRTTDPAGGASDIDDTLFQATVGYDFGCEILVKDGCLSFDTGYRLADESDIESHAWGAFLVYKINFSHGFGK